MEHFRDLHGFRSSVTPSGRPLSRREAAHIFPYTKRFLDRTSLYFPVFFNVNTKDLTDPVFHAGRDTCLKKIV